MNDGYFSGENAMCAKRRQLTGRLALRPKVLTGDALKRKCGLPRGRRLCASSIFAFPQARLKAGTQRVCQNSFASATSVKLFPLPYSMLIVNAELPVPVPALLS